MKYTSKIDSDRSSLEKELNNWKKSLNETLEEHLKEYRRLEETIKAIKKAESLASNVDLALKNEKAIKQLASQLASKYGMSSVFNSPRLSDLL